MSGFNFNFDLDRISALGELDPDDPHFAEKFFALPFEADDPDDSETAISAYLDPETLPLDAELHEHFAGGLQHAHAPRLAVIPLAVIPRK